MATSLNQSLRESRTKRSRSSRSDNLVSQPPSTGPLYKNLCLSPRTTLIPSLSSRKKAKLPYPPDAIPGARDVQTPYGSIRVYEWGPEDGRKVLMVHGISTPCVSLAPMAMRLVAKGCRVMIFDLFGRGYSDAPTDLPYDARLYTTQIFHVLTSSPLTWIPAVGGVSGQPFASSFPSPSPSFSADSSAAPESGFTLIGFSLGGGIAVDFAVAFPHLISHLVLLCPSGILRTCHTSWRSWLLYNSSLLPARLIHALVNRRMGGDPGCVPGYTRAFSRSLRPLVTNMETKTVLAPLTTAEADPELPPAVFSIPTDNPQIATSEALLLPTNERSTATDVVAWQVRNHPGFVHAFISSLRNTPIHEQHAQWRCLADRFGGGRPHRSSSATSSTATVTESAAPPPHHLSILFNKSPSLVSSCANRTATDPSFSSTASTPHFSNHRLGGLLTPGMTPGPNPNQILLVLGNTDPVIVADEVEPDARELLGETVRIVRVDAGHDVPVAKAAEVVGLLEELWAS